MTPEEALEILELPKDPLKSGTHYHAIPSPKRISCTDYLNARKVAIAALEKQIQKKPEFSGGRYVCKCGWDIYRDKQPYCLMCGQKIDWSDEP